MATVTIHEDVAREVLIALRDRHATLIADRRQARERNNQTVVDIIDRQTARVESALAAISSELGEQPF